MRRIGILSIAFVNAAAFVTIAAFTDVTASAAPVSPLFPALQGPLVLFTRPSTDKHADIISVLATAKTSIEMTNFHISDPDVASALVASHARGVDVRVVLDAHEIKSASSQALYQQMLKGGVTVRPASSAFSLTHSKTFTIDHKTAFVSTINLTRTTFDTRDLGVMTIDKDVVSDVEAVFEADWLNAQNQGDVTPALKSANVIVSPVNSRAKLVDLIHSAKSSIVTTVENIGDHDILQALEDQALKGVAVRLIIPMCDLGQGTHNEGYAQTLATNKVTVHLMPAPSSVVHPYMHSKMILVDGVTLYIGSINFSYNSTQHARELGIIFPDVTIAKKVSALFEQDWLQSVVFPPAGTTTCPDNFDATLDL